MFVQVRRTIAAYRVSNPKHICGCSEKPLGDRCIKWKVPLRDEAHLEEVLTGRLEDRCGQGGQAKAHLWMLGEAFWAISVLSGKYLYRTKRI